MDTWREMCGAAFDGDDKAASLVTLVETGILRKGDIVELVPGNESVAHALEPLGFTMADDNRYTLSSSQHQEYVTAKRDERKLWHKLQQQKLDAEIDRILSMSKPLQLSEADRRAMVKQFREKYSQSLQGFVRTLAAFLHFQRNHQYVSVWDLPRSGIVMIEQVQLLIEVFGFTYIDHDAQAPESHSVVVVEETEKAIRFEMNQHMTDKEIGRLCWTLKASHLDTVQVNEFWISDRQRDEGTASQDFSCFAWLRSIISSIFNALPHLFR